MTVSARIKTNHPDYPNFTTTTLEVTTTLQSRGDSPRPLVYVRDSRTGMVLQLRTTQAEALRDALSHALEDPLPLPK